MKKRVVISGSWQDGANVFRVEIGQVISMDSVPDHLKEHLQKSGVLIDIDEEVRRATVNAKDEFETQEEPKRETQARKPNGGK